MLGQCWPIVHDVGSRLTQDWVNALSLLTLDNNVYSYIDTEVISIPSGILRVEGLLELRIFL